MAWQCPPDIRDSDCFAHHTSSTFVRVHPLGDVRSADELRRLRLMDFLCNVCRSCLHPQKAIPRYASFVQNVGLPFYADSVYLVCTGARGIQYGGGPERFIYWIDDCADRRASISFLEEENL